MGQKATRGKRPDKRPARQRYWQRGTLARKKIRKLMHHNGMTRKEATDFWYHVRQKRIKSHAG